MTLRYTYGAEALQEPGDFGLVINVNLNDGTIIDVHGMSGSREDTGEIDYIQFGETIVVKTQITH